MLTPLGARVGNLLYFWLQAHIARSASHDLRVRANDNFATWTATWPGLSDLTIERSAITRTDRLLEVPDLHFQRFGVDFSEAQMRAFAEEQLLTPEFTALLLPPDPGTLTVNVRRGDYYTNPEYTPRYEMDIEHFVSRAIDEVCTTTSFRRVRVVSDDLDWCRRELPLLRDIAPVDYLEGSQDQHLAALASSAHVILANSTFSYWGAHLAQVVNPECRIVAPRFHSRGVNGGRAWQLDPTWHVIENLADSPH